MAISSAWVDITCDNCEDTIQVQLDYYSNIKNGIPPYWKEGDTKAELESYEWIIRDLDGEERHYCGHECMVYSGDFQQ